MAKNASELFNDNKNGLNKNTVAVAMAAVDKEYEAYLPSLEEKATPSKWVQWGEANGLGEYLYGLFTTTTSLRTIVEGTANFVSGEDVLCSIGDLGVRANKKDETLYDIVGDLARDYLLYGNAYLQVIKTKDGQGIAELYHLNARYCRMDEKSNIIYYNKDFGKKYARMGKTIAYPRFMADSNEATSVMVLKTETDKTYGLPIYIASLTYCEVERQLASFNLSEVTNSFAGSYIFNFNQGIPSDEVKKEIEDEVTSKMCGLAANGGRILLNFSNGKDNAMTIEKMETENQSEKYLVTAEAARTMIYTAFGATPNLFGLPTETTGFSQQEFSECYNIYNLLRIKPLQKKITGMFDKVLGIKDSITIVPFTFNNDETTEE